MGSNKIRIVSAGNVVRMLVGIILLGCCHLSLLAAQSREMGLQVKIDPADGSYTIGVSGSNAPVLKAGVAVQLDGRWLESRDYPKHVIKISRTEDDLGTADEWTVMFSGLPTEPDLTYQLRAYPDKPFADIQVFVHNSTAKSIQVESIRSIAAFGNSILDLGGPAFEDRVLSDSYSEGPAIQIHNLADATNQMHRGFGSQLIYNRQSQMSLLVGALTSDRFLTILRLHLAGHPGQPHIAAYEVDSTGTTEVAKDNSLKTSSSEDQMDLKITMASGEELPSERLLLSISTNYHQQLETYGAVIRQLHHARVTAPTPMGWWSWTVYYFGLHEGAVLTNAQWLSQHLKSLGYDFFHLDEGYQYARGEYTTPDATLFPHGLAGLERKITNLGLVPGIWTAPFEVSDRSWVYQNHPDWLVHNAEGKSIQIGTVSGTKERQFVLDCTNPGAKGYLRQTYSTLVHAWGIRYIKLDFMDDTSIEGNYYQPNTTAMQAQRIGLAIIRDTVGDNVLLDKDGSMMLNPVGYVDFGRISIDTWRSFDSSKNAAPGIAARYYMNRNFFISDPDAFIVSTKSVNGDLPLTLDAARISIALSEVSGGMHEIGDDLPILGSEPERLALVQNKDLINMALLGRASTPVDLMTYLPEDEQPSIFLLKESPRQSVVTVFNWTDHSRTHSIALSSLGLSGSGPYTVYDILEKKEIPLEKSNSLVVNQPSRSVRILKIVDTAISATPPMVHAQHPSSAKTGETVELTAHLTSSKVPAVSYRWDFGDGVTQQGVQVIHAYTHAGNYQVTLIANGLDRLAGYDKFFLPVTGTIPTEFSPAQNRRYQANP